MGLYKFSEFVKEEYQDRQDQILDKISKDGIGSLSPPELAFLDAHSKGEKEIEKAHGEIVKDEERSDGIFSDDWFSFKLEEIEEYKGDKMFYGKLSIGKGHRGADDLYGKFVFRPDGTLNYYIFNPVGNAGGIPADGDENYFEDKLSSYSGMRDRFKEYSEDLYKYFD